MKSKRIASSAGVAAALALALTFAGPMSAQAATWGNYYVGDLHDGIWKTHSAVPQLLTGARTTLLPVGSNAYISVPGIGDTVAVTTAVSTFSARHVVTKCKWTYVVPGISNMTCANRS